MPSLRSFSELELSSQAASRLKFACWAECEPLCSIDWFLNGRPLTAAAQPGDSPTDEGDDDSTSSWSSSKRVFRETRQLTVNSASSLHLAQLVNRLYDTNSTRVRKFAWSKQSAVVPIADLSSRPVNQLELASQQLVRESLELETVNVLSKLELNYKQLSELLVAAADKRNDSSDDELLVECKLNKFLDPKFGHARVQPNVWFPSATPMRDLGEQDDDGDYVNEESSLRQNLVEESSSDTEFVLASEPRLDLSSLFTSGESAPAISDDEQLQARQQTRILLESK